MKLDREMEVEGKESWMRKIKAKSYFWKLRGKKSVEEKKRDRKMRRFWKERKKRMEQREEGEKDPLRERGLGRRIKEIGRTI